MTSRSLILTSSPFTKAQIALGSFVPNIKQPHQDSERPYHVKVCDYDIQPDDTFDFLLRSNSGSRLKVLASKLFSIGLDKHESNTFQVTAAGGYIYSLKNPKALFKEIVLGKENGEDMQRWLESCKLSKITPRFVVGYRTFIDSRFSIAVGNGNAFSVAATARVAMPLGAPSGVTNVGVGTGHSTGSQANSAMKIPGERIYAICYRKIKLGYRKGQVVATLIDDNTWEAFVSPRGDTESEDEDVYVQADLEDDDDDGGSATILVQDGDGLPQVFEAILEDSQNCDGQDEA